MTISIRDTRQTKSDRTWIESVYRDYLNDLAPLGTGVFPALSEFGHREPDQLASWFADSSAHLLTILKEDSPVGFAMVRSGATPVGNERFDYSMAEFFIAREWRRRRPRPGGGAPDLGSLCRSLAHHGISAQCAGGGLLASGGQRLHGQQLS